MRWKRDVFFINCNFERQKERKILENKRLDLDAAKSRLKRAKTGGKDQVLSPDDSASPQVHVGLHFHGGAGGVSVHDFSRQVFLF